MRVTRKMIRPELRNIGTFMRVFWPPYTMRKFRFCNWFLNAFIKGHKMTRKMNYKQVYIKREDGTDLRLCVYTPKTPQRETAGLLWLHGGGYAIGLPEQDYMFVRRFVLSSGCTVIAPDYRLSVNEPYPAALEDCYTALKWMKEHSAEYCIRPDQLFVGGDSAGGGLTAALSLYARDRGEVSIAYQMPLYPMLDDRMQTESMRDNDAPVWDEKSNRLAWQLYLGEDYGTERVSKYAAPTRETNFSGLPPTLTFAGSVEPFRDETAQYAAELRMAGCDVSFKIFEGCFHGFDIFGGHKKVSQEAKEYMLDGFRHAIEHYKKAQP